jgi:hypothetical protein
MSKKVKLESAARQVIASPTNIQQLVLHVCEFLDLPSLNLVASVCKLWQSTSQNPKLWKSVIFIKKFSTRVAYDKLFPKLARLGTRNITIQVADWKYDQTKYGPSGSPFYGKFSASSAEPVWFPDLETVSYSGPIDDMTQREVKSWIDQSPNLVTFTFSRECLRFVHNNLIARSNIWGLYQDGRIIFPDGSTPHICGCGSPNHSARLLDCSECGLKCEPANAATVSRCLTLRFPPLVIAARCSKCLDSFCPGCRQTRYCRICQQTTCENCVEDILGPCSCLSSFSTVIQRAQERQSKKRKK